MWDRTGENQVYVRQQKAAEEQLRFDKTEKPSCLASKDKQRQCTTVPAPHVQLSRNSVAMPFISGICTPGPVTALDRCAVLWGDTWRVHWPRSSCEGTSSGTATLLKSGAHLGLGVNTSWAC